MSFRSKKSAKFKLREVDSVPEQGDPLFDSEWDALVIRFDPETRSYRIGVASQKAIADDHRKNKAKAATADV